VWCHEARGRPRRGRGALRHGRSGGISTPRRSCGSGPRVTARAIYAGPSLPGRAADRDGRKSTRSRGISIRRWVRSDGVDDGDRPGPAGAGSRDRGHPSRDRRDQRALGRDGRGLSVADPRGADGTAGVTKHLHDLDLRVDALRGDAARVRRRARGDAQPPRPTTSWASASGRRSSEGPEASVGLVTARRADGRERVAQIPDRTWPVRPLPYPSGRED